MRIVRWWLHWWRFLQNKPFFINFLVSGNNLRGTETAFPTLGEATIEEHKGGHGKESILKARICRFDHRVDEDCICMATDLSDAVSKDAYSIINSQRAFFWARQSLQISFLLNGDSSSYTCPTVGRCVFELGLKAQVALKNEKPSRFKCTSRLQGMYVRTL